ncbi:MAG: DUF3168 domain-containing protein [Pseudomonadota bacterium]
MAEPTLPLHIALLAALKSACDCDVWDAVPQDANYPYVTLDSMISSEEEYLTLRAQTRFVYLGVWSRKNGQAEIMQIMADIDSALHEQPLTLSTGHAVSVRVERTRTVREPDNLTYQGQVTLRIVTQH